MQTALIGLTAFGLAILIIPLAIVVHGIRRQERSGSLTARPGVSAAVARKLLALHATPPPMPFQSRAVPRPR